MPVTLVLWSKGSFGDGSWPLLWFCTPSKLLVNITSPNINEAMNTASKFYAASPQTLILTMVNDEKLLPWTAYIGSLCLSKRSIHCVLLLRRRDVERYAQCSCSSGIMKRTCRKLRSQLIDSTQHCNLPSKRTNPLLTPILSQFILRTTPMC